MGGGGTPMWTSRRTCALRGQPASFGASILRTECPHSQRPPGAFRDAFICSKSCGKNLITLPLRSILQLT